MIAVVVLQQTERQRGFVVHHPHGVFAVVRVKGKEQPDHAVKRERVRGNSDRRAGIAVEDARRRVHAVAVDESGVLGLGEVSCEAFREIILDIEMGVGNEIVIQFDEYSQLVSVDGIAGKIVHGVVDGDATALRHPSRNVRAVLCIDAGCAVVGADHSGQIAENALLRDGLAVFVLRAGREEKPSRGTVAALGKGVGDVSAALHDVPEMTVIFGGAGVIVAFVKSIHDRSSLVFVADRALVQTQIVVVQAAAHLFQQMCMALRALDVVGQRHVDTVWLGGVKPIEAMHVTVLAAGILCAEIELVVLLDVLLATVAVERLKRVGIVLVDVERIVIHCVFLAFLFFAVPAAVERQTVFVHGASNRRHALPTQRTADGVCFCGLGRNAVDRAKPVIFRNDLFQIRSVGFADCGLIAGEEHRHFLHAVGVTVNERVVFDVSHTALLSGEAAFAIGHRLIVGAEYYIGETVFDLPYRKIGIGALGDNHRAAFAVFHESLAFVAFAGEIALVGLREFRLRAVEEFVFHSENLAFVFLVSHFDQAASVIAARGDQPLGQRVQFICSGGDGVGSASDVTHSLDDHWIALSGKPEIQRGRAFSICTAHVADLDVEAVAVIAVQAPFQINVVDPVVGTERFFQFPESRIN